MTLMFAGIRCSPQTTLTLIRHGESQANVDQCFGGHCDSPLTPHGHAQAKAVAACLPEAGITRVLSSDLRRAMQTATPIAERFGLAVLPAPGLRERTVGELDGISFAHAMAHHPETWARLLERRPDYRPPGGESIVDAHSRVRGCLESILEEHAGGHLVLVAHAISIHLAIHSLLGLGNPGQMTSFFAVSNGSRSTFQVGRKRIQVVGINATDHLPDLSPG